MPRSTPYLIDVNFWLALTVSNHDHHTAATSRFASLAAAQAVFCRPTQQGFLRLLTTAAAMDAQPLTMAAAWHCFDQLCVDERVSFVHEPKGLEIPWRQLSSTKQSSPKRWMDSYLTAFAATTGMRVLTFDTALAKWPGVEVVRT